MFATSGAIFSLIEHYTPLVRILRAKTLAEHPIAHNPVLAGVVWFILALIAAPLMVLPLISETHKKAFIDHAVDSALS